MIKKKGIILLGLFVCLFFITSGCNNFKEPPVPTEEPTPVPTEEPTPVPTEEPAPVPTEEPAPVPTEEPTPITAPAVKIQHIEYDPEGEPDCDHEYILLINASDEPQNIANWSLKDEKKPAYVFPAEFVLQPGEEVKVWTGEGDDTETDLYQDCNQSIWNNDRDIATLKNSRGEIIDIFSYGYE